MIIKRLTDVTHFMSPALTETLNCFKYTWVQLILQSQREVRSVVVLSLGRWTKVPVQESVAWEAAV